MKKITKLSLAIIIAMLASCTKTNNPISSTNSNISINSKDSINTNNTDNKSTIAPVVLTEKYIISVLNEMKKGNYTLEYDLSNNHFEDVITKKYYHTGYLNNGSVLLKTYLDTEIAYDYQIITNLDEEKEIDLKGQTFNQEQTKQELTNINFANKFSSLNTEIEFKKVNNLYRTDDEELLETFQNQLDFNSNFSRAEFYLENDNLTIELKAYDLSTNKYYTPQGAKITITNVGTSKIDEMENFLNNYSTPKEALEGKADNLFSNVSFESAIYDYTLDYNRAVLQGYSNLDIYNEYIRTTTINDENIPYTKTYKKQEDGSLHIVGINGKNELIDKQTTMTIDDFQLVGKEGFNLNLFRKINSDDNYYLYLGKDAKKLAYSVTQSNIFSKYQCLKIQAKVENNKVTELHFYTGTMQDKNTGEYFFYRIDTKIKDSIEISTPIKKTPSKDDVEIKNYLSYLNSEDSIFEAIVIDSAWDNNRKTVYKKGKDFYIKTNYIVNGETLSIELGNGYYKKDDKIYTFSFDNNNVISMSGFVDTRTFTQIVNFSISSEILYKENDKIKTTGDIIDIGKSIGFSEYQDYVDPSSLNMEIKDNRISTISYNYGGSGFTGTETISLNYSNIVLGETLKTQIEDKISSFTTRMTWENYSSQDIYNALVESFDSTTADKIPYLSGMTGFDGYENDDNDFFIYTMETDNGYIQKYKSYLLTIGYNTTDNKIYTNTSDNLKLVIGETLDDFLHISKIN